ncbi:MAG TPA: tRNA glutamyl-Q(34) synthetase GluQRS [Xanthobacteraceae bacterium]|jgi:glutamyl-Q tRNA(Asp) synthetase
MTTSIFRFAPSPNGHLHLGHAYSALLNFDLARVRAGRFLLRIEDIDATRCRPEYETAIYDDLTWLGLAWEAPVRRQSEHFADYQAAIGRLAAQGLVYASFESRAEIARLVAAREAHGTWPRDPDGAPFYPGDARTMSADERDARMRSGAPYALRLNMAAAVARIGLLTWREQTLDSRIETIPADPAAWGDVVLARKEMPTSYHVSVVVDDAAQGVTEVVRGADLQAATSIHRLLQALLGLVEPVYLHHRLIAGTDGRKLSKSTQATGLRELRAKGATPAEIRRMVGL